MRKSRVVLIGVAVAAAAAAGSAFTASNDFSGATTNVAGYGSATVTGAHVTAVHYTVDPSDNSALTGVTFTTTENFKAGAPVTATAVFTGGTSPVSSTSCDTTSTANTITCVMPSSPAADVTSVALTVVS